MRCQQGSIPLHRK